MSRYIVQHRRGSAAQWASKDTIIPMEGEIVIEIDDENAYEIVKEKYYDKRDNFKRKSLGKTSHRKIAD